MTPRTRQRLIRNIQTQLIQLNYEIGELPSGPYFDYALTQFDHGVKLLSTLLALATGAEKHKAAERSHADPV